jgi:predicted Na+-dependent transporter
MFQFSPSDADLYWYLGKTMFVTGIIYMLLIAVGVDPVPSSPIDLVLGIVWLALVPAVEQASNSTPLYRELDFGDE